MILNRTVCGSRNRQLAPDFECQIFGIDARTEAQDLQWTFDVLPVGGITLTHHLVGVAPGIHPVSLNTPIGEEEDSNLGDFIEDKNALAPVEAATYHLLRNQVEDVLASLTLRERRVLQLRFGLEDGRSRTLEEVGREFGVTRERIRQIEAKALRKLRHPTRSKKLRDFLD